MKVHIEHSVSLLLIGLHTYWQVSPHIRQYTFKHPVNQAHFLKAYIAEPAWPFGNASWTWASRQLQHFFPILTWSCSTYIWWASSPTTACLVVQPCSLEARTLRIRSINYQHDALPIPFETGRLAALLNIAFVCLSITTLPWPIVMQRHQLPCEVCAMSTQIKDIDTAWVA